MPITALSLTTRSGAGAALTQTQHDTNLTAIQTAVNALITQLAAKHNDDGTLKTNGVTLAAQLTDGIVSLAKMAALTGTDKGKWLRANASSGAVEMAAIHSDQVSTTAEVNSSAATAPGDLTIGTFTFNNVPAGDVLVFATAHIKRNAGANGGTVYVNEATAGVVGSINTHCADGVGTGQWVPLSCMGRIADFAGGTLTLLMKFETSEASSDVTFGVAGEDRFGRRVMILAGL